jgi:hypothetical protein
MCSLIADSDTGRKPTGPGHRSSAAPWDRAAFAGSSVSEAGEEKQAPTFDGAVIGVAGFEPAISQPQIARDARLRYTPWDPVESTVRFFRTGATYGALARDLGASIHRDTISVQPFGGRQR